MRRTPILITVFLALVCLTAEPPAARAQSAFTGVVKDITGAVLPGVTIEASSPVLIERVRSVISNESGAYKILDLRPGVYTLTFSLPGFATFKREGIELPSNFTATINAEMQVGGLEETVTVATESPVVDLQTNSNAQVLPREILDMVPTAHTIQSVGQLVVGVSLTRPDVGGSEAMQQTYFNVHGLSTSQTSVQLDGMIINGLQGDGAIQSYINDAGNQEMVYQTGGGSAESPTGGVKLNLAPKEGGNSFHGSLFVGYESSGLQSNNLTPFLRDNGVTVQDKIGTYHDINVTQGGPIIKDRLWFFVSGRLFTVDKPVANTFYVPQGLTYAECLKLGPSRCQQGIDDQSINSGLVRLTWQVSPRNKFSGYMDRIFKTRGHAMSPGDDPVTASVRWNSPIYMTATLKWTATVTPKLLIEGGYSSNIERYNNMYQPNIRKPYGTPEWYATAHRIDNGFGTRWKASATEQGNYPDRYNAQASMSYVTGAHTLKLGFQNSWGPFNRNRSANADLYQNYTNGVPVSVTPLNTPLHWRDRLNANLGIYAQDSWTFKRITLNLGGRWEYVSEQVDANVPQQGRFSRQLGHDVIKMPIWRSFSPRTSAVIDLFGNGKTAVRFGFNRFDDAAATSVAERYDPMALVTTVRLSWTDLNGDDIAQGELGCVYRAPGCEINFAQLPRNFGVISLAHPDPAIKRPYWLAYNLGVQREILPGVSVTAEWFHTEFKNISERNNVLRNADSYTPVDVVSPLDGRVITAYNVKREFVPAVQNVDTTDPRLRRWYNSFEFSFNAKLPRGGRLFGGSAIERTIANTCAAASTNPNFLIDCDQSNVGLPWRSQFKLVGTIPWKWGLQVSGVFQSLPGYVRYFAGPGFTATGGPNGLGTVWQITPSTRYAANCKSPCTPGALVVPGLNVATLNVPLVSAGTEQTPRINQLDLSIGKWINWERFQLNPKIDVFNALNSSPYFTVRSNVYNAATYNKPGTILQGRIVRLGAVVNW